MELTASINRRRTAAPSWRGEMLRGALAIAPLLPGAAAFGIAFALVSRSSGFSPLETQLCSLLVFAGSAQLATTTPFAHHAGVTVVIATVLVLNLRHVLYAMSLDRRLARPSRVPRGILAFLLTDEAYGFSVRQSGGDRTPSRHSVEPYY